MNTKEMDELWSRESLRMMRKRANEHARAYPTPGPLRDLCARHERAWLTARRAFAEVINEPFDPQD